MPELTSKELERRRKISESARASPKRQAYYARIRGQKRGPDPFETRARKSASHRAPKATERWQIYRSLALAKLEAEARAAQLLKECSDEAD